MLSLIAVASLVCLALGAVVQSRRVGLDNISVSREWLANHNANDRS